MAKQIGIDLGTANTVICVKGYGIVMHVPSVIAFREQTHEVIAVGHTARQMLGKTPPAVRVERPLRHGVITDADVTARMLHEFFQQIEATTLFGRPEVFICAPCGLTPVERSAVGDVVVDAGARRVEVIEEPLASAIGAGIRVESSRGSMIVDIGGGTTEIAVVSSRGIIKAKTLAVAGDSVDTAIVNYMRYRRGILIGDLTAEGVKFNVGSVHSSRVATRPYLVYGRDVRSKSAAKAALTSQELCPYLQSPVRQIVDEIIATLAETPPEFASAIYENGITITGGTSKLEGLRILIEEMTGLKVRAAERPLETVCAGLSSILESEYGSFSPVFRPNPLSRIPFFRGSSAGGGDDRGKREGHGGDRK